MIEFCGDCNKSVDFVEYGHDIMSIKKFGTVYFRLFQCPKCGNIIRKTIKFEREKKNHD